MKWILALALLASSALASQAQHSATYNVTAGGCTSAATCTLQIYRQVLAPGVTNCPAVGDASYIAVQKTLPGTTSGTSYGWNYVDTGASLISGATYCGYETATNGGGVSSASAIFQGIIPTTPPQTPVGTVTLQ